MAKLNEVLEKHLDCLELDLIPSLTSTNISPRGKTVLD